MAAGPLKPRVDSFVLTLRAAGRSERTATMYSEALSVRLKRDTRG
ncbi:hypothetical protein [Nocardiopsis sp. FIRDI 009]|nr:hypothetical protein [Nocardiopsis sp. FIRDI 009]